MIKSLMNTYFMKFSDWVKLDFFDHFTARKLSEKAAVLLEKEISLKQ